MERPGGAYIYGATHRMCSDDCRTARKDDGYYMNASDSDELQQREKKTYVNALTVNPIPIDTSVVITLRL